METPTDNFRTLGNGWLSACLSACLPHLSWRMDFYDRCNTCSIKTTSFSLSTPTHWQNKTLAFLFLFFVSYFSPSLFFLPCPFLLPLLISCLYFSSLVLTPFHLSLFLHYCNSFIFSFMTLYIFFHSASFSLLH